MSGVLCIGLMSGTSLDGIDAVLVKVDDQSNFELIDSIGGSFTKAEREKLFDLSLPATSNVADICSMNAYLGEKYAKVVEQLLEKSGYEKEDIHFISSHGQTIYHLPTAGEHPWELASTLQIGDLSVLSEKTGIGVVGDFRPADMAANGQGAPLTSFADYILFADDRKNRAIQNIGGIGNVTFLPKGKNPQAVQAFDTGPGNMIIDELVKRMTDGKQTYDVDGLIARKGQVNQELLDQLMAMEYILQAPPKTTGRELFGKHFVDGLLEKNQALSWEDLVTTMTEFTCQSIVYHYENYLNLDDYPLDELIVGGGGTYNKYIMDRLQALLPQTLVSGHERFGMSSDLKEAIAFAILGYYCLTGRQNTIPSATGADHAVIMGKMTATHPEAMERMLALRKINHE